MKQPKINANAFEVEGSSSGNPTLGGNVLPITSSEESPRNGNVGVELRIVAWARALLTQSAAICTERVIADQDPGCEQQRAKITPLYPAQDFKYVQEWIGCGRQTGIELALWNRNHDIDFLILADLRNRLDPRHKAWYGYQYDKGFAPPVIVSGLCSHVERLNRCIKVRTGTHVQATAAIKNHPCRQRPVSHWKDRRLNPLNSNRNWNSFRFDTSSQKLVHHRK